MSFRRLLTHRATFHNSIGQTDAKDAYNRRQTAQTPTENVPCRVDRVKKARSVDEKGTDFIYEHSLFCLPSSGISEQTSLSNIRDRQGNVILEGTYNVYNLTPVYRRSILHHYEAVLKRV